MIVDVGKAINFTKLPCKVKRLVSQSYENGELVLTYGNEEDFRLTILPMSGKELRNYPEGEFDYSDMIAFQGMEYPFLKPKDLIFYKGTWFEVRNCIDLVDYSGVMKYTAKRVNNES